jgi:hypothetical protein
MPIVRWVECTCDGCGTELPSGMLNWETITSVSKLARKKYGWKVTPTPSGCPMALCPNCRKVE